MSSSATSFSFSLSLSSCSYINFPSAMYKWQPPQHASCALSLCFVFPFENGVPKCHKKTANLFINNLQEFWKFTVSSISHFGNIKEVWYKDWQISLYKPGQVTSCRIIEKFQIIELKISFHNDNFPVDFFKDANFAISSVDFS